MKKAAFVFLLLLYCATAQVKAQPVIEINYPKSYYSIGTLINTFIDEQGELSINEVLTPAYQARFIRSDQNIPNIGITEAVLWCQLKISNTTSEECYLELFDAAPDSIAVYEIVAGKPVSIRYGGNYVFFRDREIQVNNYLFRLCGKTDSVKTFYVRVRHSRGTQFPVMIGTIKGILEHQHKNDFLQGIYFGIMLLMVLYNLCIYFSLRDSSYLYYVFYGTCMTLTNGVLTGYAFEYLWPASAVLNSYPDIITASLGISGILFTMNFLQTKKNAPVMHRLFTGFLVIFIMSIVLVLLRYYRAATLVTETTSFLLIVCFFITAFSLVKKGFQQAKYFLFAWSVLLLGACIFILKDFDILPYNTFTVHSLQIGSAIEAVLLSFALTDKINISKKEKWDLQELHRTELFNNQLEIKKQTMQFIGREIHDNIGQKLTLAGIYVQRMEFDNLHPDMLPQLKGVSRIINDSLAELRDLSKSLAENKLEHDSLEELLQIECERINNTGTCKAILIPGTENIPMNIMVKNYLLRTIQEFMQNSLKHSGCKQIQVRLNSDTLGFYIQVTDDGKGFDIHALQHDGIGLNNMKRRAQTVGATFLLQSEPGKGTELHLFIPAEKLHQSIV